jgi:hypothetical protein
MCAGYMRDQAQKKANALLRCMPSGVVIVGDDMRIIECNEHFAGMFSEDTKYAWEACPGLAGAHLDRTVPFAELFGTALRTGQDIRREVLRAGERLFNVTVFTIEPHQVVGGVIQDVTGTELRREQIARRARKVIRQNLATVQEIACRLGENMAETEILLRSIADDYAEDAAEAAAGAETAAEEAMR